jgi:anti-anti-sigma regulatory factor
MFEDNHSEFPNASMNVPNNSCKLVINYQPERDVFLLTGVIDAEAKTLLDDLAHTIKPPKVIFDFGGVRRINSMGVALLLRCFKKLKDEKHLDIRLANLTQVNTMLFRITGIFLLATPNEVLSGEHAQ